MQKMQCIVTLIILNNTNTKRLVKALICIHEKEKKSYLKWMKYFPYRVRFPIFKNSVKVLILLQCVIQESPRCNKLDLGHKSILITIYAVLFLFSP